MSDGNFSSNLLHGLVLFKRLLKFFQFVFNVGSYDCVYKSFLATRQLYVFLNVEFESYI
jgi:hypothetical protein